ncbi:helix-turn-helix domain-containing protein [Streptomyces sp. NPDC058045]|uniref:helix-turn-helix domain-containing protein n=1 Tax=Streptomyces sp. NPDC058045 TaxID=3346311 RepID=UPI0036E5F0B1
MDAAGYGGRRAEDLLRMNRLARSGGSKGLLDWLVRRTGGWAALLTPDGRELARHPPHDRAEDGKAAELAAAAARRLTDRGLRSVSLGGGGRTAFLLPLDAAADPDTGAPLLALVIGTPIPAGLPVLLADLTVPLGLCWTSERAQEQRHRVELAEARNREAVLHLLMTGQLSAARRIAGALRPQLPDHAALYVVRCPQPRRDAVIEVCRRLWQGRAWVVRCPVYSHHVIVIAPSPPDRAAEPLDAEITEEAADCVVGVSHPVPLVDIATGYAQAFHALAVAGEQAGRRARFGSGGDPALLVGAAGSRWADELLAPLRDHVPRRGQDPDGQELAATLSSWLSFSSRAVRQLKIHRNTLAVRLRLVEELVGLDLARLGDQAALALALRIRATPGRPHPATAGDGPAPVLDDLLARPEFAAWAAEELRPLDEPAGAALAATLHSWLRHSAHLPSTAAELGISVPGARKRLTRLEALLERSLLHSPSARHDLWLACRALDLARPATGRTAPPGP